jgi:hypothetical protein
MVFSFDVPSAADGRKATQRRNSRAGEEEGKSLSVALLVYFLAFIWRSAQSNCARLFFSPLLRDEWRARSRARLERTSFSSPHARSSFARAPTNVTASSGQRARA